MIKQINQHFTKKKEKKRKEKLTIFSRILGSITINEVSSEKNISQKGIQKEISGWPMARVGEQSLLTRFEFCVNSHSIHFQL